MMVIWNVKADKEIAEIEALDVQWISQDHFVYCTEDGSEIERMHLNKESGQLKKMPIEVIIAKQTVYESFF